MDLSNIFRLVVGTRNEGKVRELKQLFKGVDLELVSLNDFDRHQEVDENGSTFLENAKLKASSYAQQTQGFAVADDSGLEILSLGNSPGVHSARYAGIEAPYSEKIARLLFELKGKESRRARFVCEMAVAEKGGNILFTADGICNGTIAEAPRGENGFGYDPIFIPDGYAETFGELADEIKLEISHRARAGKKIIRYLLDFIEA